MTALASFNALRRLVPATRRGSHRVEYISLVKQTSSRSARGVIVVGMSGLLNIQAWQRIRVLRAKPPARVVGERARVFTSALEQAEQLMGAAADVGPAASPLLLFYSVSQAGRAIAAARLGEEWRLSGHGLKAPAPADRPVVCSGAS